MEMEREIDLDYDLTKVKKNPYAEKMHRARTVVIDEEIINFFKEQAKEKGVYHGILISETLKDYIANVQREGRNS